MGFGLLILTLVVMRRYLMNGDVGAEPDGEVNRLPDPQRYGDGEHDHRVADEAAKVWEIHRMLRFAWNVEHSSWLVDGGAARTGCCSI